MKKILIGIGSITAIATPVVVAISCGTGGLGSLDDYDEDHDEEAIALNYNDSNILSAVTFVGENGKGVAVVSQLPNATITVTPSTSLSNDDVVNITIKTDSGFTLDESSKTTKTLTKTVSGLGIAQQQNPGDHTTVQQNPGDHTTVQQNTGDHTTVQQNPATQTNVVTYDPNIQLDTTTVSTIPFNQNTTPTLADMELALPQGSTVVSSGLFSGKTITYGYELPDTIERIESESFKDTTLPQGFTLPEGITTIGMDAFHGANGYNFVNGNIVPYIKLKEPDAYINPDQPTNIPNVWTSNPESHNLWNPEYMPDSFTIPSSVRTISMGAFVGCDFSDNSSFQIPDTVTSISPNAFGSVLFSKHFINKNPNNHPGWAWGMYGENQSLRPRGTNPSDPFRGAVMKQVRIIRPGKNPGELMIGYEYTVIEFQDFTEVARTEAQLAPYIVDGGMGVDEDRFTGGPVSP